MKDFILFLSFSEPFFHRFEDCIKVAPKRYAQVRYVIEYFRFKFTTCLYEEGSELSGQVCILIILICNRIVPHRNCLVTKPDV